MRIVEIRPFEKA